MTPKVLVLFRNDDLCAWSNPAREERLLRLFTDYKVPMTLGVVPKVRGWHLTDNRAIVQLLEQAKASGHELALHGLEHDHHEFERLPIDELRRRLAEGQRLMRTWFGEPAQTFIPPDNALSRAVLSLLVGSEISVVSSGPPLLPLLGNQLFVVDAVARLFFAPLVVLIRHLASLPLSQPLPLVIYFHSWEVRAKPHWEWLAILLQTVRETEGVVATTFAQALHQFPDALRVWVEWRQDETMVQRWNSAFHHRAFRKARVLHRYWRDSHARWFPAPALEEWLVRAYAAAVQGDVRALEQIVLHPARQFVGTTLSQSAETLIGWCSLAAVVTVHHFARPRLPTKMEDALGAVTSPRLATLAGVNSSQPRRSLVYLSFDFRLVSEHAAMTSRALAKRGWQVTFVHPQGAIWNAGRDGLRRIEVENSAIGAQKEMAKLIASWRPPIVYARQHWQGILPLLIAHRHGIPYVAEFNGLRHRGMLRKNPKSVKAHLIRFLELWSARLATALVVPSRTLAERIAELVGSNTEIHDLRTIPPTLPLTDYALPLFIVPNGIDPVIFCPCPAETVRQQLGLPTEGRYIVYAGSLHVWQGIDVLLHAFARLRTHFPDCRLLIVGGQDEPGKDTYHQLARELRVANYTHFIPFVPYEQSALWIAAGDVCVAPYLASYREYGGGSPLKVYAYLSCGRPIVLSDLGEFVDADLVRQSGAGLLVPPGDPEALADALARLLADPSLREEMGKRGREAILSGYTWDHNAERIERVLEGVMRKV